MGILDDNFNAYFNHVPFERLTCEMSVQEDYREIRWMQAKPGSRCVIYVLSTFLKYDVLLSPSFVVFYVF